MPSARSVADVCGQTSHLPLKLNMSGVIPPIFASSLILFPSTIGSSFGAARGSGWLSDIASTLSPGQPLYVILYAGGSFLLFFLHRDRVQSQGDRGKPEEIRGLRAGDPAGRTTAGYIDGVMTRLTLAGAIYITSVCMLPEFLILKFNVPFYFGGTSC